MLAPIVEDLYVFYPIKDNRIEVNLNNSQKASLFDYFSHIELIPLETNSNVLIGSAAEIIHYQDIYFVFDRQQRRVFVFDDTGKFKFQINKHGRGPGEYFAIHSIFFNPFTKNIDILDYSIIHSYDLSGKHIKTSPKLENPLIVPLNFIVLNEKTYVFWSPRRANSASNSYRISYYNVEENKIFHQEYEIDTYFDNSWLDVSLFYPPRFYEYHSKWFFSHRVDNVTYEVGPESLTKAYAWDFGRLNYDAKKLNLPIDPSSITTLPYSIDFQDQNNKYIMAFVTLRNKDNCLLIYDKSTDECKCIEYFTESVDFMPKKVTNEHVLSWVSHGYLENYITEEILDETNRQKFKDLMNEKTEMNPIIIKYYF